VQEVERLTMGQLEIHVEQGDLTHDAAALERETRA
jgi:hypothetical protein